MMNEKYTIGWNTFEDHLRESSKNLFDKKHFADVTLVSEDLVQIQAHRFILSSSSPVLEKLLLMNQDSKALIYLKGIKYEEMEALTKFIYLGETKVQPERVDDFLKASADLEIKYFHNNSNNKEDKLVEEAETLNSRTDTATNNSIGVTNLEGFECYACKKVLNSLEVLESHVQTFHQEFKCDECDEIVDGQSAYAKHIQIHQDSHTQSFECSFSACKKTFPRKVLLEMHEYRVHQEFRCEECNIYFKGKNAFHKHAKKLHPQGKRKGQKNILEKRSDQYACANCSQSFSDKDDLEKHIDHFHKETCDICKIRVLRKNLNRHKLTHEEEDQNEDEDFILDDEC